MEPTDPQMERIKADKKRIAELQNRVMEDQLMLKKRKIDKELQSFFDKEQKERDETVNFESGVAPMDVDPPVDVEIAIDHPDDVLNMDGGAISDVSDDGVTGLVTGTGGASKVLSALDDDLYISTWTVVITASVYQVNPRWRKIDEQGVHFDKEQCHLDFRRELKTYVKRMKRHFQWDLHEIESVLFEENPDQIFDLDSLRQHGDQDSFSKNSGRVHGHILVEYNGNRRRGTQAKLVKRCEEHFKENGWQVYWSCVYDHANARPLNHSREKQQSYLMLTQYRILGNIGTWLINFDILYLHRHMYIVLMQLNVRSVSSKSEKQHRYEAAFDNEIVLSYCKYFSISFNSLRAQKEVIDLCPSATASWSALQTVDLRQWKELQKQMARSADRDAILSYLRRLPEVPANAEAFLSHLREKVNKHQSLYSTNRMLWRKEYYTYLNVRQIKKAIERGLVKAKGYRDLVESLTVDVANESADWGFKHFWQRSLTTSCKCGCSGDVDATEADLKKLKYSCPEVTEQEQDEVLQGRTKEAVRSFVLRNSNYRIMKLMLKHKLFKEPLFNILWLMGRHFFLLCSDEIPTIGKRVQNV